ncbi:MAG: hypothetical protein LUG51_08915 [Tannerellaceae bacterium]|nr:hypothetical protein [Tannerellaceae bacterium]
MSIHQFFFRSIILITLVCQSCDSNDITTLYPLDVSQNIQDFFPVNYINSGNDIFIFDEKEDVSLYVINNEKELLEITKKDQIPVIDWQKYTLLIGQYRVPSTAYLFSEQSIQIEKGKQTLLLRLENSLNGWNVITHIYFWGIYEKLPDSKVDLSVEIS